MFRLFFFTVLFLVYCINLFSQSKEIIAVRTNDKIVIDGQLDEPDWKITPSADNFTVYYPILGKHPDQLSEVKILYNNHSIYFGAVLYDNKPDSIYTELTVRDNDNGNVDYFKIFLNPNNDGQNVFAFIVSAANVQTDIRISGDNYDYNWDAVWFSAVTVNENGWIVEIEIPYSAIRFPKTDEHIWAVNFFRTVRRTREISAWNPVDKSKGSEATQMGRISGIKDIDTPLRLSLLPYASGYLNTFDNTTGYSYSYGLDLKLGLSETYTLDMTLIPDFGQTKTDELVLNLTPHETYYSENRPFFTEGIELFNKAGLFYSRRIGKTPNLYDYVTELADNDSISIISNPNVGPLINAFKISGKNSDNLALGIFNAITGKSVAKLLVNDITEIIVTEPAANYNLIVLDKTFGLNNYVNFTNANLIKPATDYLSNVNALSLKLMDKSNVFGITAYGSYSYRRNNNNKIDDGFRFNGSFGKMNGTWVYYLSSEVVSEDYNPNDLGYLTIYNQTSTSATVGYRKFSRFWKFNDTRNSLSISYSTLMDLNKFTKSEIKFSNYATTVKHLSLWNTLTLQPAASNDYYEPRSPDRFYKRPAMFSEYFFMSTDYRKKLAFDFKAGVYADTEQRHGVWANLSPLTRFGKKLGLRLSFSGDYDLAGAGYFKKMNDDIIFSRRDVITFSSSLKVNYVFNPKISVSCNARHYVSNVDNYEYYKLMGDGSIIELNEQLPQYLYTFNIFNIDLLFSWNFLPGSYLSVMWKNQIFERKSFDEAVLPSYFESFKNIWEEPMANSFSVKFIYYLDYYSLVGKNLN